MTARRPFGVGAVLLLLSGILACAGRTPETLPAGPTMAVYRARLHQDDGRERGFRLLLFARLPDRLHAEVVSPVGTTELIVDAGAGTIAVTPVDERRSFVGQAVPEVFESLFGIRLSLAELVRGLLLGERPPGIERLTRVAPAGPGLPEALEIATPPRRLVLQLKRRRPLPAGGEELGTGRPPAGMDVRPLQELDPQRLPAAPAAGELR